MRSWLSILLLCLLGWHEVALAGVEEVKDSEAEQSFRVREYGAYLPVEEQEIRLKTGMSSYLENPTGICFAAGERVRVTVRGGEGQELRLIVHDFSREDEKWYDITRRSHSGVQKTYINPLPTHSEYELQEGENELLLATGGLGYLHYRSATPQEAPKVEVRIEGGQVNGVITHEDSPETCKRLLEQAKCGVMDMLGERVQLVFPVEGLRAGCGQDAPALIALYDRILGYIQDDLLGWGMYGENIGNHILIRVIADGSLCAGEMGVFFPKWAFPGVAKVSEVERSSWGPAHEFGHQMQTRPGMRWIGMVEVTNNICAAYVNYKLAPSRLRLETSRARNSRGEVMPGGIFDCFVNNAITHRRLWQFQGGALPGGPPKPWEDTARDVFTDVAPLWQLLLYRMEARGQKDFYPQIYRSVRHTDESKMTQGELRVLFCKRACDAAQLDLSEFFVKTGILAPIDRVVSDYEEAHMTITREMCEEAIAYAARYPKPDSRVIYYITAHNLPFFRDKIPVERPAPGYTPPPVENERMEMPAHQWQFAVAFEAYQGDKLLHVSLFGLNNPHKEATTIICPAGTDTIKAVQWDGTRYTVLGPERPAAEPEPLTAWLTRSNGVYSLHEAARAGDVQTIRARLSGPVARHNQYGQLLKVEDLTAENAPSLNARNEQGLTPLELAEQAGHEEAARLLRETP